ncbi:MAG: class I SAM-dependent methyltransferase [Candidatus Hydrothermales bacterium]
MKEEKIKEEIYKKIKEITEKNEDWAKLSIPDWEKGGKEKYISLKADTKRSYAYFVDYLDKLFNLKNKKVLDLGCGFGNNTFLIYEKNAKVFAVDIEKDFVYVVNLKRKLTGYKIYTVVGDGLSLPFKDNSFDLVICTHTLEHIKDPFLLLREMKRVLRNRGILYLSIPNYLFPFEPHFRVILLPYLSKKFSKVLLKSFFYKKRLKKINKRWEDIPFLENFLYELNFIKYFDLEKLIKRVGFKIYKKNFVFKEEFRPSKKLIFKKILKSLKFFPFESRFIAVKI